MFTALGNISFDKLLMSLSEASVYIRILDVSMTDTPSKIIVEKTLSNITISKKDPQPLAFSIHCPTLDAQHQYVIDVHVDRDSDGEVSVGDLITMESYPITLSSADLQIDVKVLPVQYSTDASSADL